MLIKKKEKKLYNLILLCDLEPFFETVKYHYMNHYVQFILMFEEPDAFSSQSGERAHKTKVKLHYRRSNKNEPTQFVIYFYPSFSFIFFSFPFLSFPFLSFPFLFFSKKFVLIFFKKNQMLNQEKEAVAFDLISDHQLKKKPLLSKFFFFFFFVFKQT